MSSFSLKITGCSVLSLHRLGFNELPCKFISGVPRHFNLQKLENSSLHRSHARRICSVNGESNAYSSDPDISTSNLQGSREKTDDGQESVTSSEILKKLKRYGISGILSYGLLNTAYYLTTFLLVWFYVAPAPAKMGYFAAVERFLKVMAMVWAGSQVTKLVRAGGALALAPFVDRGLSWFTVKFKFESQGKAFMAIVGFCFGLAFILFLVVTLL
ncbi:uncharacterized protein LOC110626618 [Manihot esculenta]|uniref:Uncharacterized protein n=1 Tax=Manihot esculenta TaxID=3983 RepID=A0A2C9UZ99_MANES|nr:uncharacterized protein LOC110626618 [Manihot esculenta]OAY36285.1 hypothetical protein MANES_11G009800v8 [Manihot esculenta]